MARIEKRHGQDGSLVWAKGLARNIYKDQEIADSKCGRFRIEGEARLYHTLLPRHCATSIVGDKPNGDTIEDMVKNLPPFKNWLFVMLAVGKSKDGCWEVAREISGDVSVEYVRAEEVAN